MCVTRFLFGSLALLLVVLCSMPYTVVAQHARIVGAATETNNVMKIPSVVSVRRRLCSACAFEHYCGGVIYAADVIISAANCVRNATAMETQIVVGTNYRSNAAVDGSIYPVKNFTYHPNGLVDLVLIRLSIEIEFNPLTVQPIALAEQRPKGGVRAVVAGWGQMQEYEGLSESLREARVPIVDMATCRQKYWWSFIRGHEICAGFLAGGADACHGDAGSPLIVQNKLAGIVSWGYGCGRANYPGVYTDIVHFRNWILADGGQQITGTAAIERV